MKTVYSNSVYKAGSKNKSFGFVPVPGKFGATTNYEIPDWIFDREIEEFLLTISLL